MQPIPSKSLFVREVMRTKLAALPADAGIEEIRHIAVREPAHRGQHLYPVVDTEQRVTGVITRKHLRSLMQSPQPQFSLNQVLREPVVAHPDEPLRLVVLRMADSGFTRMPVVENETGKLVGMISLDDLLLARVRNLNEERHRERPLQLRFPFRSKHPAEIV